MNIRGKIALVIIVAVALFAGASAFGFNYIEQQEQDRWGRELEAGMEKYSRGKIDVLDVRRDGNAVTIYLNPRGDIIMTEVEFTNTDDALLDSLKTTDAEVIVYVWAKESTIVSEKGKYNVVSITECSIQSIIDERRECSSIQRFTPLEKKHLRWKGISR